MILLSERSGNDLEIRCVPVKVPTPPFGDDASGTAMETAATIREGGEVVWDGSRLVGSHAGIYRASAVAGGVEFAVGGNAEFVFASS